MTWEFHENLKILGNLGIKSETDLKDICPLLLFIYCAQELLTFPWIFDLSNPD